MLGQRAVGATGNEITAAREVLELFDLRGVLVTGDALHCQGETARLVRARGGDWLFPLKANRPAQLAEVEAWLDDPVTDLGPAHVTTDADHGRIEVRRHRVCNDVSWLVSDRRFPDEAALPGLAMIGVVECEVGPARGRPTTRSRRLYLSSAALTPEAFARAVRAHWAIENGLHWVLDTAFDEYSARNRKDNAPENLAVLRRLALNLMRTSSIEGSIQTKRKRVGWSDDIARAVLGQMR